jgi:hypothetical protein
MYVVAQLDYNWIQTSGAFLMRFKPYYNASETNNTPLFSGGTLTASSSTGYSVTDGTTVLESEANGMTSGANTVVAFLWDADESLMAISYSNDGGATFAAWHQDPYDGTMSLSANLDFFKLNGFVNRLYAARIYSTPGKTVAQIKNWIEANSVTELT